MLSMITSSVIGLVTLITITIPTWLFTFLSRTLTLTISMTTLLVVFLLAITTTIYIVRYRWLNKYSRLPPNPSRKEPPVEVFPDTKESDLKPGLSNYLDEFLSAIKVFGYLERPVFHELTRTIQTKKLIAGETISLEEEKGFCLVVDGVVEIFVKSKQSDKPDASPLKDSDSDDQFDDKSHGYQLLTEVRNGAPMSSLFSVLSLFTDNVRLRHDDPIRPPLRPRSSNSRNEYFRNHDPSSQPRMTSPTPMYQLAGQHPRQVSQVSQMSSNDISVPPMSLDDNDAPFSASASPKRRVDTASGTRSPVSAHPDIVARASVDTTIVIIPATAFHRLTRIYPKATAHIVQVILTRLQRVTLATANSYLGLSDEVLCTERLMDKFTAYDLPDYLRGSALERLKHKFVQERERTSSQDTTKGIALHNSRAAHRARGGGTLDRRLDRVIAESQATPPAARASSISGRNSQSHRDIGFFSTDSPPVVSAGDLLTTDHSPSNQARRQRPSFSQPYQPPAVLSPMQQRSFNPFASPALARAQLQRKDSVDEDYMFRESILECMLKAIGLENFQDAQKPSSTPISPRLHSHDNRRQKASFNGAFGFLDPFEGHGDGDSESATSVSGMSTNGPINVVATYSTDIEIVFFPKDAVLVEQGERNPGLYYVIDGFLDAGVAEEDDQNIIGTKTNATNGDFNVPLTRQKSPMTRGKVSKDNRSTRSLFLIKPGGLAGYIGTVGSHRSFINVTAKTDVYVGFLPKATVEKLVERFPIVLLTMAKRLTSLLPKLILHIDFALEWVQVNAGQIIFNQKDESDAIFIVLNGRLRALQELEDNKVKVIGEYGQGDSVGELEVMTETARPGTLHAIRDTELAKFPKSLFNSLALEHPGITIKISKIIASRMRTLLESTITAAETGFAAHDKTTSTTNLRTVTVLPVTGGVPVVEFGNRLLNALNQIGTPNGVVLLNQTVILNHLGRHAFSGMGKLKLSQYLADLEEKYGLLLYIANTNVKSPWTQTCINQADCILLVGLAESSSSIGEYERLLLTTKTTARKELVLLHSERYCPPGSTSRWLRNRPWINGSHHHIQMSFTATTEPVQPQLRRLGTALKHRVQVLQAEIQKYTSRKVRQTPLYSAETPFKGDFHRLARRLCGKSVGLVLGGGGARGFAHVGVIRAMEEAGIPIDIVGGTSIGSFIGALYAWDADVVPMYGRAKKFAGRWGSLWRFALDLTYPSVSYTTGHEFNRGIFKTFGDAQIEDFWLEFFCNTTNISKSRCDIHNSGYVWRYVRASMSLAGLLPPLCDEGNMLLDGGYIDNLPVAHMKSLGADVIFAIDVGALDDDIPQDFGDSLSGLWASLNRWNPFSSAVNPPSLSEIQGRLAYVSSIGALNKAKNTPGCMYLRPPIDPFGTLEFGRFEEIYQVGYNYGQQYLQELRGQGSLPVLEETEEKKALRRTMAPRRASI